jgi:DNA-directed RNA polymerase subunit RPC12/RpoP
MKVLVEMGNLTLADSEEVLAELARYDPTSWPFSCCAPRCGWHGNLTETREDHCPRCGGRVFVHFRTDNRKWTKALIPEHCGFGKAVSS